MPTTNKTKRQRINHKYYLNQKAKARSELKERKLHFQTRLPESIVGHVHRLVLEGAAAAKWPWKTLADCTKFLLVRGIESLRGDETIDELLPALEHQEQIDRISRARKESTLMLNRACEEITELIGIKEIDQAATYYHMTLDSARKLPPTVWSAWMLTRLEKAFPALKRIKPKGVNLNVRDNGDGTRRRRTKKKAR